MASGRAISSIAITIDPGEISESRLLSLNQQSYSLAGQTFARKTYEQPLCKVNLERER